MSAGIFLEYKHLIQRKSSMERKLASLPQGYISHKTINGKEYSYLQNRVNGKVVSEYLKLDEIDDTVELLSLRKQYETELPLIDVRITQLEKAAALIGNNLDRTLMMIKSSAGMDELDEIQKRNSISFANAMNAVEGVPVSEQTAGKIAEWLKGKISFETLYEATLIRYGFTVGETK